jgi:hypothetical protein
VAMANKSLKQETARLSLFMLCWASSSYASKLERTEQTSSPRVTTRG